MPLGAVDSDDRNGLGDFLDFRSGTSEYGLLERRLRSRLRLRRSRLRLRRLLRLLRRLFDLDRERRDRDRDLDRRLGRRSSR